MDRYFKKYIFGMIFAGVLGVLGLWLLGWALNAIQSQYWGYNNFFHYRLRDFSDLPYWFVATLAVIFVHCVFMIKLSFMVARIALPSRGIAGTKLGGVEAYLPVHFLKILGVDLITDVLLLVLFIIIRSNYW